MNRSGHPLHLAQPGATTSMTVTGSNFAGGAVLVTGPGAVVTHPVVNGSTDHLRPRAGGRRPAESRTVIVVTENGTAQCDILVCNETVGTSE